MKKYLAFAAIGAMAAIMAIAQTTTAPNEAPARRKALRQRFTASLNLTPAQKQQGQAIRQSTKAKVQPLVQQLKQDRQILKDAIQAGDTAKIQQVSSTIGNLRGQVMADRATGMAQFYASLTPDQKVKAQEFHQQMKQMHRHPQGAGGE
jgi:Spy/CpxP family protein refolding chaperone